MLKLVHSASFFPDDVIPMTLLNLKDVSASGLEKTAADDRISDYVSKALQPEPGKFYVHINAMGAGETWGSNRNGDYFPRDALKQYHHTFCETGYIYRHHINKDPAKSMGRVVFSIYNDRMDRVELIAWIDMEKGRDIYDRLQKGDFPATSMACKTPWDVCSICGNKARTRQEYCTHLSTQLNRLMPDGKKVMALNVAPLRFIDQSIVVKPADVTSSVLQKVAYYAETISSADEAIEAGLTEYEDIVKRAEVIKASALKKWSELTKKIEGGIVTGGSRNIEEVLKRIKEPKEDLLDLLEAVPIEDTLNAMAEIGVSPSVPFLAALITRKVYKDKVGLDFGHLVEDYLCKAGPTSIPKESIDMVGSVEEKDASPHISATILRRSDASFFPDQVEKRASRYFEGVIDTQGALPHYDSRSKQERELVRAKIEAEATRRNLDGGVHKTLLGIGGAAILMKMIIASLLEEKIKKQALMRLKYDSVEKQASVCNMMEDSLLYIFKMH